MTNGIDFSASDAILNIGGKFIFLIMLAFLVFFRTDSTTFNSNSVERMIRNTGLGNGPNPTLNAKSSS